MTASHYLPNDVLLFICEYSLLEKMINQSAEAVTIDDCLNQFDSMLNEQVFMTFFHAKKWP